MVALIILALVALALSGAAGRNLREAKSKVRLTPAPSGNGVTASAQPVSMGPRPVAAGDIALAGRAESPTDAAFAEEAKKAAERVRRETSDARALLELERRTVEKKLERARKILVESGLWDAVPDLYSEVRFWPAWSKRDDWNPPLPVTGVSGESGIPENGRRTDSISWCWEAHSFRISLVESRGYDGEMWGRLSLEVDHQEVVALSVSKDLSADYSEWRPVAVDAFVAGPWMTPIAELTERLRAASRERTAEFVLKVQRERADRIRF